MRVVVARIGRPHGVRGDVTVETRTDEPDQRLASGAVLATDNTRYPTLTVETSRWHSGRLLLHFQEVTGRTEVEALRGTLLSVDVDPDERPADPEEFYDHQLVGLNVVTTAGIPVGIVNDVVHGAQDLLIVARPKGGSVMIPFVAAIVPEVDLEAGRVVVDPPDGLLDLTDE
ncbi:MAG: ribosome maturation factor RimM [Actinomycetes bacterium]